ncbi:hypothetical protein, partial [Frankia sp. R82]|uniref:hypothetical protein n=1 Tax=Frankia sp. R82 TaxID=2950553 RepID=UPI00204302BB
MSELSVQFEQRGKIISDRGPNAEAARDIGLAAGSPRRSRQPFGRAQTTERQLGIARSVSDRFDDDVSAVECGGVGGYA